MRILLTLTLCCLASTVLRAEGLSQTPCPTDTLADYINNFQSPTVGATNGPCSVGILNFSEFSFSSFGTPVDQLLGSGGFELTPVSPGNGDGTGFTISPTNPPFSVTTGNAVYVINWFFAIDSGPISSGADLGMDPTGDVSVTAQYCLDSFMTAFSLTGTSTCYNGPDGSPPNLQSLSVTSSNNQCPVSCSASIVFPTPAFQFANVRTIISLNSDQGPAVFDSTSSETVITPGTPEPGTWLLVGGGALLIGFLRRRAVRL
jgi:hypothetical protein